jgi:hypothetical protein
MFLSHLVLYFAYVHNIMYCTILVVTNVPRVIKKQKALGHHSVIHTENRGLTDSTYIA